MNLIEFCLLWCSVSIVRSQFALEPDAPCLTGKAHRGRCVQIDNCPELRRIAYSTSVSQTERLYLQAHRCGTRMVCCENPLEDNAVKASTTTESVVEPSPILPDEKDCGLDNGAQRIYGGEETEYDQFRWTVALEYNTPKRKGVHCGGSLINTKYVITAAHCVVRVKKEELKLRLGEWDLENNPDCDEYGNCNPDVVNASISRIIIHPGYILNGRINDIALLRMAEALPDNYAIHILPICLPLSAELRQKSFSNDTVSVVGWGRTELAQSSKIKMHVKLVTTNLRKCKEDLSEWKLNLNDMHICAQSGSNQTRRDTCDGDSGGPLQIQVDGSYYLIGVVSFGLPCGRTSLPAVYTRITFYLDWILENILH